MAEWLDGIVVENYRWTERLTSLKIEAALGPVQAGQFVRLGLEIDGEIVVARASKYVSEEIHQALFPRPPARRSLEELDEGVRDRMRRKHAGD